MWDYASDGYWWVHIYDVITNPPKSSSLYSSTTLHTSEGDVLIATSMSVNSSACLVGINYYWETRRIVQTHSRTPEGLQAASYYLLFRPFSYNIQLCCLQPKVVNVRLLICHQRIRGTFPKRSGN